MPRINTLAVHAFRNLDSLHLPDLSTVNVFWGNNGSGKTSLLESVYFLATGRSFRSPQIEPVIQKGMDELCIYGNVSTDIGDMIFAVSRHRNGTKLINWDGERIKSFAPIAQALPVQFISTLSYRFFSDGPKTRRQFFDWVLFHVEPLFYKAWKTSQQLLKQRNSALKKGLSQAEVTAWDPQLSEMAEKIDCHRMLLLKRLTPLFCEQLERLAAPFELSLAYDPGWDTSKPLKEVLMASLEVDYHVGYTRKGPQRADFQLMLGNQPAVQVLSQGQQKLSMYALHLACGNYLHQATGRAPIYLIDDMPSELDPRTQSVVLDYLTRDLKAQLFLTGITSELFDSVKALDASVHQLMNGCLQVDCLMA